MTLLSPINLLWLLGLPVLVWLWRLAASQRTVRIPSLVPFEHLMQRLARRRRHLVVNTLFWLQVAALVLLAAALAHPALWQRRARTVLVILDTSASMGAVQRGSTLWTRGARALSARLTRAYRGDRMFLMTTAPVRALSEEPLQDSAQVARLVEGVTVSDLAGSLSTAAHIGRALVGGAVDRTLVVTDESPPEAAPEHVEFLSVGVPLPNAALVGLDTQGGFCAEDPPRLVASVQNFSREPARIEVIATQRGRTLAQAEATLARGERASLVLAIPEGIEGWLEVALRMPQDALAADNRAWVAVHRTAALPVAVRSDREAFNALIGRWLGACRGLTWTAEPSAGTAEPHLVVTDGPPATEPAAVATLQWLDGRPARQPVLAHWLVDSDHPVGSYLGGIEVVAASLETGPPVGLSGEPVVWGVRGGEKVPVVVAGEHDGRRRVAILVDPVDSPDAMPLIVLFFNSLRWLMGQADLVRTGEPFWASALAPGLVAIERPDGRTDRLSHPGGTFHYDETTRAGLYRLTQGHTERRWAANFLDPLESDLLERPSSWQPADTERATPTPAPRTRRPLARTLTSLLLALLLAEWWLYSRKRGA